MDRSVKLIALVSDVVLSGMESELMRARHEPSNSSGEFHVWHFSTVGAGKNISLKGAPPLVPMWRTAR